MQQGHPESRIKHRGPGRCPRLVEIEYLTRHSRSSRISPVPWHDFYPNVSFSYAVAVSRTAPVQIEPIHAGSLSRPRPWCLRNRVTWPEKYERTHGIKNCTREEPVFVRGKVQRFATHWTMVKKSANKPLLFPKPLGVVWSKQADCWQISDQCQWVASSAPCLVPNFAPLPWYWTIDWVIDFGLAGTFSHFFVWKTILHAALTSVLHDEGLFLCESVGQIWRNLEVSGQCRFYCAIFGTNAKCTNFGSILGTLCGKNKTIEGEFFLLSFEKHLLAGQLKLTQWFEKKKSRNRFHVLFTIVGILISQRLNGRLLL